MLDGAARRAGSPRTATRRGPRLRRGPGPRLPAQRRHRHRASLPGERRAGRHAGSETGTEVTPYYDPLLAKVIVARATAPTRSTRSPRRSTTPASTASRPTSAAARGRSSTGRCPPRPTRHRDPRRPSATPAARSTCSCPGAPPCRTCPAGSAVARRRAAERADGRPVVPAGQPRLGNADGAPGLECTATGPDACASPHADRRLPHRRRATVDARRRAGAVLGAGRRSRPADARRRHRRRARACARTCSSAGGFDVPAYLGSASTFTLGGFGGHGGRRAAHRRRAARWSRRAAEHPTRRRPDPDARVPR